jgi:F-type H+-transporting ATPase subunit b
MEKLGINLGFFLFQVFNFLVLLVLLYAFAYRPVLKMMATRKEKIAQGLEDARVAAEARAAAEQEAAKIISEAQTRAAQVVREASERAEVAAREVKSAAEQEAVKAREVALVEVEQGRERILGEVRGQVAALAIAAAQKLIGEALDDRRQRALIDEFFSGVKAGRVTVLEGARLSGISAEITSALPLTEAEKAIVQADVLGSAGAQAQIKYRVDPSILGGLVIRAGGKVLDASVAGQLENLRQKLG